MATNKTLYFCDDIPLRYAYAIPLARFRAIGGKPSRHNYADSFSRLAGNPAEGNDAVMPVTRTIFYKRNLSLHKCGPRCLNATGHDCECSCGGANHGKCAG